MTLQHHPTVETLATYASGTLDRGRRVVVASHLERCAACREAVRGFEQVGGVILEDLSPAPLSQDALAHTLARIEQKPAASAALSAAAEPELSAVLKPYAMGKWRWVGPGVHMRPILVPDAGDVSVFLLKAAPGTRMPEHTHSGTELTSILVGSYHHDGGDFHAGDFEEADGDVEHRPVVSKDRACICLVALEGRLKLSGAIGALLNPFIRL